MVDVHDIAARSKNMRAIRAKNTKPELIVRSCLHSAGFRFRLHRKDLPGKPDVVLPRHRVAILVHGCFWHGHACPLFKLPGTRTDFWLQKIRSNRHRDIRDTTLLVNQGWRVLTVWECALKGTQRIDTATMTEFLADWVRSDSVFGVLDYSGLSAWKTVSPQTVDELLVPHRDIMVAA